MNCDKVQELMAGFVDEELSTKERVLVEKHLKECVQCLDVFTGMKHCQSLLQNMPPRRVKESFTPQLIESIKNSSARYGILDDWKFIWGNFWSASRVAKASYSMATAVLLIVSIFTFQSVFLDDNPPNQHIAASDIIKENTPESGPNPVPVVLPPVPDENLVKGYRFDLNSNQIKTIFIKDGEEQILPSQIDAMEYDRIFGHILYNRAMLEKRVNNELMAKNLLNRILNDKFFNDQELKSKVRVELTSYSSSN